MDNDNTYIISLFYYEINNIETYNILLTTKNQWLDYTNRLDTFRSKGFITDTERIELINIVEKEKGYNQLYSILRKVSYILSDLIKDKLNGCPISLVDTNNPVKINLYRNIIKSSFNDLIESEEVFNDNKYFIYKSKSIKINNI